MERIKDFFQEKWACMSLRAQLTLFAGIFVICVGGSVLFMMQFKEESNEMGILVEEGAAVRQEEAAAEVEKSEQPLVTVWVDVKGAVKKPGVYECLNGERVQDAIEKAGGAHKDADLKTVNLSKKLIDEMVVYVPKMGEEELVTHSDRQTMENSAPSIGEQGEKISLNDATAQELETLPGIGPKKAQNILAFREQQGGFKSIEQLKEVDGIGEKTFEQLASLVIP